MVYVWDTLAQGDNQSCPRGSERGVTTRPPSDTHKDKSVSYYIHICHSVHQHYHYRLAINGEHFHLL